MSRFSPIGCAIIVLALLSPLAADDIHWPGWLGPDRDGWVSTFVTPAKWPAELKPVWQVEVGTGYSSPLVANGQVFQHARQGEDEVLACFDLQTGAELWRQQFHVPFKMGGGGERHGKGPKSSAAYDAGRVFTMSITGVLTAWDASNGKKLWQRDYDATFGQSRPYWGAATSPIVDGNRVIVHFGTDERGALVALDVETGKEIWTAGDDGASYSSPLLVEIDGVRQIVEWNHVAVAGFESTTGKSLWQYSFPHVGSNQNMPTPTFFEGRVIVGGENRGIVCIEPTRNGETWEAKEIWHQDKVALDMSSTVINDGLLIGFSHYGRGRLFCLDPKTGNVLWEGPPRTGENVMFLSIPGYVVALINHGELRILESSSDSYKQAASYRVSESETWAPPVLLEKGVLVKDHDRLTRWSFE